MKNHLPDVVGLAGMALIAVGAGMVYIPAGFMVGGALMLLLALFGFTPEAEKKVRN
jgi:amino acid permease